MPKGRNKEKKKVKKEMPPSSYITTPHYFRTEQIDMVKKLEPKKRKKK